MNVAYFLIPKSETAYLFDDYTLRQALEKMRARGYTRIPVISRDGKYINVVGEGDFLWYMLDQGGEFGVSMFAAESLKLGDELIRLAMNQNFVPVIDDEGYYIGIVTRRNIIRHFVSEFGGSSSE